MDNKEAITRIKNKRDRIFAKLGKVAIVDALDMAIKSMEQVDVLDKIRAEIEALEYLNIEDGSDGYDKYIEQYEVLRIIDKYTAEK